ncbi:MAG: hypothetical protein C4345_06255, partial [Chloroflexota bacterium]
MKRPSVRADVDVADGAMLLVATIWAGNNVLTKSILNQRLSPYSYVALRFLIVAVVLFGWLGWRKAQLRIRREDVPKFVLTGLTGYAAYNLLFIVGLAHTSAFSAAIIVSLGPVFTLLIASAMKLERIRPVQWLGVACALLGTAVFVGNKLAMGKPATGDALNLLAAACFAVYGLATRSVVRTYGSTGRRPTRHLPGAAAARLGARRPQGVDRHCLRRGPLHARRLYALGMGNRAARRWQNRAVPLPHSCLHRRPCVDFSARDTEPEPA